MVGVDKTPTPEHAMDIYVVKFTFIENGHTCKTSWSGSASSREAAVKTARDWFGFDQDGIEVLSVEVE